MWNSIVSTVTSLPGRVTKSMNGLPEKIASKYFENVGLDYTALGEV